MKIGVDMSLLIQMANFIFLILVLNVVLYKPIRKILSERKSKFDGLKSDINSFTKDAEDKEKAFGVGIKEARANGIKQKDTLIDEASKEEQRIIAEINEKAQADLAEVRNQIKGDAEKVRGALMQEVNAFAQAISQKVLGRAI